MFAELGLKMLKVFHGVGPAGAVHAAWANSPAHMVKVELEAPMTR